MRYTIVAAVNDEMVLKSSLLGSPGFAESLEIVPQRGYASAAAAYNQALDRATCEVVIFAHQDVYFPDGWLQKLAEGLHWLATNDPEWGVLGIFGVSKDQKPVGWTYSTGLGKMLGGPFPQPLPVRTLDEVVLIVRRGSGLRFDERLKGFHMYGTDLCMEAERRGLGNYVLPAFAIHNSNGIRALPLAFWRTYWFARRKWWSELPISAPCAAVTRSPLPMLKSIARRVLDFSIRRQPVGKRAANPSLLYAELLRSGAVAATAPLSLTN